MQISVAYSEVMQNYTIFGDNYPTALFLISSKMSSS